MNSFFNIVKQGYLGGLLIGILLGLPESIYINWNVNISSSFWEWILFYFTTIGLYSFLGIMGGIVLGVSVGGLSAFYERLFSKGIQEKFQFSLILGIMFGTIFFIYLRFYSFSSFEFLSSLLLLLGSISMFFLTFLILWRIIYEWIKLEKVQYAKITIIFMIVLVIGWTLPSIMIALQNTQTFIISQGKQKKLNVLLITIDTLRADHVGVYGYSKIKTPILDRLAEKGTIFTNHICQQPITTASHASILTSTYPISNGVIGNNIPLDSNAITLPEILSQHGYVTGAFVSAYPLKVHASRLDQGFQYYDDRLSIIDNLPGILPQIIMQLTFSRLVEKYLHGKDYLTLLQRRADETTAAAMKWLDGIGGQNFFIWVHYFDPHAPYDPPPPYNRMYDPDYRGSVKGSMQSLFKIWDETLIPTEADIQHIIALYDGEISFTDEQIGVLLDKLKQMQVLNNTVIIVTADHGESLWEHDYNFKHGDFLYESSLRIPLIITIPGEGIVRKQIDYQTENIDIVPTILEVLKIPKPSTMQGESLLGLISGKDNYNKKIGFAQAIGSRDERYEKETRKYALRTIEWKLVQNETGEDELYHIKEDSAELKNLITFEIGVTKEFNRLLNNKLTSIKKSEREIALPDEDTLRRLKGLGYIN